MRVANLSRNKNDRCLSLRTPETIFCAEDLDRLRRLMKNIEPPTTVLNSIRVPDDRSSVNIHYFHSSDNGPEYSASGEKFTNFSDALSSALKLLEAESMKEKVEVARGMSAKPDPLAEIFIHISKPGNGARGYTVNVIGEKITFDHKGELLAYIDTLIV